MQQGTCRNRQNGNRHQNFYKADSAIIQLIFVCLVVFLNIDYPKQIVKTALVCRQNLRYILLPCSVSCVERNLNRSLNSSGFLIAAVRDIADRHTVVLIVNGFDAIFQVRVIRYIDIAGFLCINVISSVYCSI